MRRMGQPVRGGAVRERKNNRRDSNQIVVHIVAWKGKGRTKKKGNLLAVMSERAAGRGLVSLYHLIWSSVYFAAARGAKERASEAARRAFVRASVMSATSRVVVE